MAQPTQVKFTLPNNDWAAIDNSAAGVTITINGTTSNNWAGVGFDITTPGAIAQGLNSFGDTGTVLLDTVNDTVYADPQICTVKGNPVAGTPPTFATVTTVLNNATTGIRLLWKNPA